MPKNDNAHSIRMVESLRKVDDSQEEKFAQLEYISENKLLFCYPSCYCACVKRVPKELSKTWCYCTLGNAEGIFEKLFLKQVKMELVETIKSGGERCVMSVEW